MDSRLSRRIRPGRVINIQRSNGEGRGGERDAACGGPARARAHRRPLPGLIQKATVKTVSADRSCVSVEWFEGSAIKGKEVSEGPLPLPQALGLTLLRDGAARRAALWFNALSSWRSEAWGRVWQCPNRALGLSR